MARLVVRAAVVVAVVATSTLALVTTSAAPASARPLAPFIDLQERGITLDADAVGLRSLGTGVETLSVDVGGSVRFALLYWGGRQTPCDDVPDCTDFTEPYRDQEIVFQGTPITGTVIGTESRPAADGFDGSLEIAYFADVTSIVSAAGTGTQTFSFMDGATATEHNLTQLDGASLLVAYTDPAEDHVFRLLVMDGGDFADGDDPAIGENRTTRPLRFNQGTGVTDRTGELLLGVAGGGAGGDTIAVSANPDVDGALDGSDGDAFDLESLTVDVPALSVSTIVQVESPAPGGDSLLWMYGAFRVPVEDPACSLSATLGPPAQVTNQVTDDGAGGSGLLSILVTKSENADTVVPPFTPGTTGPVAVTSTKIDQSQPMSIEVEVADSAGNSTTCAYSLGAPPVAVDDTVETDPGVPVTVDFLANDSVPDGDALQFSVSTPGSGIAVVGPHGDMTYTPNPGFTGVDTFSYFIIDGLLFDTGQVVVAVFDDDAPPVCAPSAIPGPPFQISATAIDIGGPGPASGLASILVTKSENADTVVPPFTPGTTGAVGVTSTKIDQDQPMTVEIELTDLAGNSTTCSYGNPPVATDDTATTQAGTAVTIDVLGNDTDADGNLLLFGITTGPSSGTAVEHIDGTVTYTPDPGFTGDDTFTYTVSDGIFSDTAEVRVSVFDDLTPPECSVVAAAGPPATITNTVQDVGGPGAASGLASIVEVLSGNAVSLVDPFLPGTTDPVAVSSTRLVDGFQSIVGFEVTDLAGNSATCTYGLHPPTAADDTATTDEQVDVTIDVLANDIDADLDTLAVTITTPPTAGTATVQPDGSVVYSPNPGFDGTDTFGYTVTDGIDSDTATVTVTVNDTIPPPPPPVPGAEEPEAPDLCRPDAANPFDDVGADDVHAAAIACLADLGVLRGDGGGHFRPSDQMTRGQLATAVRSLLHLVGTDLPAGPDAFDDDDGDVHEADIDALAAAGILHGTADGRAASADPVSRAQAASIVRAAMAAVGVTLPDGPNAFDDDDGDVHEADIDALADAGVLEGTAERTFDPSGTISRAQAATVLVAAGQTILAALA